MSDSTIMAIDSATANAINKQENRIERTKRKRRSRVFDKTENSVSLNTSTIESRDANASNGNTILEEMLKPRWILGSNESQRFKIRYQPEEVGIHRHTYALSIVDGDGITYDINVHGVADIPRLDMNPNVIFSKVEEIKVDDTNDPTYFSSTGTYDFGSLLVFRKDKSDHRREAEFKFHNISEVDAEVYFYLRENVPDIFIMEQEKLYIQPGQCGSLKISAGVTKLGPFTDKLHICVANNPHIDTIELRCNGTKLDIELEDKQLSFGQVLLYRRDFLTCVIRNRSPVQLFWHLIPDKILDPQISFTPTNEIVKAWSDRKIEFCYYASKIGKIQTSLTFKAFFHEDDVEPIYEKILTLTGETYDVAVDINYANPIDLKCVKVGFPVSADFTISNRGNYEIKYVILPEKQDKLNKIAPSVSVKLKEHIEIRPASGSIQPGKEATVQVTFLPKSEIALKECPILRCHLLDTNKQAAAVAEIPLTVSLVAYYTKFRVYPYPEINFDSLAVCAKRTMYLNVENTGQFPLHYSIQATPIKYPYTTHKKEDSSKRDLDKDTSTKKEKKSSRIESSSVSKTSEFIAALKVGPFTIKKTEGSVQPGEIDTVTIECCPEFVGPQEERIFILVPDSVPEDRDDKLITLSVNSCVPSIDFQDLDAMFRENYIVDRIQDFICPRGIGAHTVFARGEKCLYFRYVSVSHTHTACFALYNRNVIPADVELTLLTESLAPAIVKLDTFVVTPERERIPPTSHKRFAISFNPTLIETCYATLEMTVEQSSRMNGERFCVKLVGQACVPVVTIVEPPSGKRERAVLNFGRTFVNNLDKKKFILENVGVIPASVIVEIYEDPNFLFALSMCDERELTNGRDCENEMPNDRCIVVRLMPEETASFEVKFTPREIGKYEGQVRLLIVNNPYENLMIDLKGEAYAELIVLEGLELINIKSNFVDERREYNFKSRKSSARLNSTVGAFSTSTMLPVSLIYKLDYGHCFVNKINKKNFRIVNKSMNQYFRFQWSAHPNVVFTPSIGHLKYLTCKEMVAIFLSSEPTSYVDTYLDCTVCAIELVDLAKESCWDNRETEVRWITMDSDDAQQETNSQTFARKAIEPVNEPSYEIVPGTTKCIQILFNATAAFSKYSCLVKEINFKDTLMFQIREYVFSFSNTGTVETEYMWQINVDEQYPTRPAINYSRSTPVSRENTRSKTDSSANVTYKLRQQYNRNYTTEVDDRNVKLNRPRPLSSSREGAIEIKPAASVRSSTDHCSSSAGLTERTSDSWLESDDTPFGIYPEKGILPPGESVQCTLRFSPMGVLDYKAYLTCKMENLDPELPELVIPIAGRSLLPYCHFDIPENDYPPRDRGDARPPGLIDYRTTVDDSLPEGTRVIELNVVGIGETHVKKFRMINPTSDDYHFTWKDRTCRADDEIPYFHCVLTEGIAERGKQVDFAFTFLAEDVGTFRSLWVFSIEKYSVECPFLFVAIVREPSVHCPLVHLKMKPTVLGVNVQESISVVNDEEFQIPFQIARDSLYSEGHLQNLRITPACGTLGARSEQILRIEYQPTLVGEFQFSVKCIVRKMKTPLTVFVTTMTYDVVVSVTYIDQNGQVMRLRQDQENIIDCGKLMLKAPIAVAFEIMNSSKMTLCYSWDLGMTPEIISRNTYAVEMPEKQGHVASESRVNCYLTITALQKTVIKNHSVLLKISRGPTYRLILKAMANRPFLKFSFNNYDFGPCYIRDVNAAPYHIDLRITNLDDAPYILECKFEEKPHISVNLDALSQTVAARSSINIPIKFRPLDQMHYRDNLHFIINSAIEKRITVTGEGITYKVRLVNPRDKAVDLGSLPINRTISKKVPVINDGRATIELKFDLMKRLPGYERLRERIQACPGKSDRGDTAKDRTQASAPETILRSDTYDAALETIEPDLSEVLEIEPAGPIVLQPAKVVNVIVKYKPKRRMRPFAAKVAFQTDSTIRPLFIARGSCVGAEFRLNRTHLSFGIVVQDCLSETRIVLLNTGDIGARFKWNISKLPRDFSIAPATGYCSPGMDVNFIVSFRPTRHDSLIEGDALLEIEKYGALGVKIAGGCCKLPDPVDTLLFSCHVREKLMRSLNVENDTATSWELKPEVTGDYFTVDKVLYVPSKKSATCTITYAPLVMNNESNPHKSTLLLKLPNDKVPLVYSLQGLSLAPRAVQSITRQFPAKAKYTELLPVYNWMSRQQRFECKIENLANKEPEDFSVFTFMGNSKIDVPANSQRDYRAEFHSYKESTYNFKVTFTNQEGEYQFYELQYIVTKPEGIESIKLFTSARSPVCYPLKLDNPLGERRITYTATCRHPCVTIHDVPKTVAPSSSEIIGVEYHPVHPGDETVVKLDVHCEELGLFPYELRLRATPAPEEKATQIVAMLGGSTTFSLTVNNPARKSAVFAIEVNNECFTAPRDIEVPALKSVSFDVIYEPCDVDNVFAVLTATSETAGEFVFPLVGTYSLPKPQGPYTVTPNAPALIPFKNVFKDTRSFEFVLDDPEVFVTITSLKNIEPKQVVNIAVSLKNMSNEETGGPGHNNYPITGKLLVFCTEPKISHVNWIYYLRAVYD